METLHLTRIVEEKYHFEWSKSTLLVLIVRGSNSYDQYLYIHQRIACNVLDLVKKTRDPFPKLEKIFILQAQHIYNLGYKKYDESLKEDEHNSVQLLAKILST